METLALIFIAGIAAWILLAKQRRKALYRDLGREGVPTKAEVVGHFSGRHPKNRSRRYYLRYRFETAQGHAVERQVNVSRSEYEGLQSGDRIDVLYLPARPSVSHTATYLRGKGFIN